MTFIILTIILLILALVTYFFLVVRIGQTPRGKRLELIKQSSNYRNGRFRNEVATQTITSNKRGLKRLVQLLRGRSKRAHPETAIESVKTDLSSLDESVDYYVWFGHSSFLLNVNKVKLLVDPVLTNSFPMSLGGKPFKGADIYTPEDMPELDYLLLTHDHWDHLDYNTVKRIKHKVKKVICPLGVGQHLEHWGYKPNSIIELDWKDSYKARNNIQIHCLPSRHFSGRWLSRAKTLWASYLISTDSKSIYISGDGGYDNRFWNIKDQFGKIDVAIMENGQYNVDWAYVHLLPQDLLRATTDLAPDKLITVHHSKFVLGKHDWDEPLQNIEFIKRNYQEGEVLSPIIGQVVTL